MVHYECIYSYFAGIDADTMYLDEMGAPNSFGQNSIINPTTIPTCEKSGKSEISFPTPLQDFYTRGATLKGFSEVQPSVAQ
jgi:hypothetical protein